MNKRVWSLLAASFLAMVLLLAPATPANAAVPYQFADYGATTIPLWGPTWGKTVVTAKVESSKGVSATAVATTRQAIADWNDAINTTHPGLFTLQDITATGGKADIILRPKAGGGSVQGQALQSSSGGLFTSCKVNVSGKAFGSQNSDDTVRSIALQELGHCLGLLHADNTKDVMYGTLQSPPNTIISACDMKAWDAVMHWLVADGGASPHAPHVQSVSCP